jgi:hypothetical protein
MSQAFNLSQFANKVNTSGQASLTTAVTGTLPVANGGTGAATLTANNVILGNGTSAVQTVAPGSNGNILTSNGTTWISSAPSGGVTSVNGQTGAVVTTDYGVIGSYVIAGSTTNLSQAETNMINVTVAGSTLVRNTGTTVSGLNLGNPSTANQTTIINNNTQTTLSLSGTWRGLSRGYGSSNNMAGILWVRIS